MSDVTQILTAIESGDAKAADELLPLVYNELRKLASAQMAQEKPGHTLDATALVHEAYIRLVGEPRGLSPRESADHGDKPRGSLGFANRRHFFAAAAEAMRRILVESARRKGRLKRGGQRQRQLLDEDLIAASEPADDILALDEALQQLAKSEPQVAELVRLRHFVGLTVPQAAEVLEIAPRTADAWWKYARTWLQARIQGEDV